MSQRMLTWDQAVTVRRRHQDGETIRSLAKAHSVTEHAIAQLVCNETYKEPERRVRTTVDIGKTGPMVSMAPESIKYRLSGELLQTWLLNRGCDQRDINRITARRFSYGSYRPSDRAAIMLDASPILTPFADDLIAAAD